MESEAQNKSDYLIPELLEEFRWMPEESKPIAVDHIRTFIRLSELPAARLVAEGPYHPANYPKAGGNSA